MNSKTLAAFTLLLFALAFQPVNAEETTISFESTLTQQTLQIDVVLPAGYEQSGEQRYPIF